MLNATNLAQRNRLADLGYEVALVQPHKIEAAPQGGWTLWTPESRGYEDPYHAYEREDQAWALALSHAQRRGRMP